MHTKRRLGRIAFCGLLIGLLTAAEVNAQTPRKVAFLVGVSQYDKAGLSSLTYAEKDMQVLAEQLRQAGFTVKLMLGSSTGSDRATRENLRKFLEEGFLDRLDQFNKRDIIVIGFSGHGQQLQVSKDGRLVEDQFICPVDAVKTKPETLVSISDLMERVAKNSGSENNLLLIDACRDNPAKGGKGVDGSTITQLPVNLAVLFSSSAGRRSYESDTLKHGVLTYYVVDGLRGAAKDSDGEVTWDSLVNHVKKRVPQETASRDDGPQRPNAISNLQGIPPILSGVLTSPKTFKSKSIDLEMVLIDAGEFQMGSPASETEQGDDEFQHRARITKPFYLGKYEVTQSDYQRVTGSNPSYFASPGSGKDKVSGMDTSRFPVESVSWYDAVEFCNKLSQQDGFTPYYALASVQRESNTIKSVTVTIAGGNGYRLPTEAEWEYACRAGTTTPFHFGASNNGREANVDGNYPYGTSTKGTYLERTTNVGTYAPNRFGLYDMHGNVYEWCWDWYDKDYYAGSPTDDPKGPASGEDRVLRGGSWDNYAWNTRSANRYGFTPDNRYDFSGFRVSRTP